MGVSKKKEENLEPFMEYFPISQWNKNILLGPSRGAHIYCKACDIYILLKDSEDHVLKHKSERESILKKRRKDAAKARAEALKRAREEKELLKELNARLINQ